MSAALAIAAMGAAVVALAITIWTPVNRASLRPGERTGGWIMAAGLWALAAILAGLAHLLN